MNETVQYIQHRINVASVKPQMPFDKGALNAVYRFSEGIPRLINTACDRMLLAACLKEQTTVKARLANEIIEELSRQERPQPAGFPWLKFGAATAAVLLLAVMAVGLYIYRAPLQDLLDNRLSAANNPPTAAPTKAAPTDVVAPNTAPPAPPTVSEEPETSAATNVAARPADTVKPAPPAVAVEPGAPAATNVTAGPADTAKPALPAVAVEPDAPAETNVTAGLTASPAATIPLEEWVSAIRDTDTRREALAAVLQQWGLEPQGDMDLAGVEDSAYFQLIAERHGLLIHTVEDDLDELARLDLPAIIQLDLPQIEDNYYAGLIGIQDGRYLLASYDTGVYARVEIDELEGLWGGIALVPWKNYLGYRGIIPDGAPRASVVVLKQLLWELGHSHLIIDDHYDAPTRNVVREIQAKHGLVVDGLVGDLTKIVLYNEKQGLPIPHLRR
jgi:general secretion pathway protein A